jgi:phosphoribosylformylglycinamidine synthase
MFKATISITLRPSILDPEGKQVHHALTNLGYDTVDRVRMGKQAELWIDAPDADAAEALAAQACQELLANPVTENFAITITEATEAASSAA